MINDLKTGFLGVVCSVGSWSLWINDVLNPVLSAISLLLGIIVAVLSIWKLFKTLKAK